MADEQKAGSERRGEKSGGSGAAEAAAPKAAKDTVATPPTSGCGGGEGERTGAAHDEAVRTGSLTGGTTEAMADELKTRGVDHRLDNRTGRHAPRLPQFLKPQQVPGPEIGRFSEHDAENREAFLAATGASELPDPMGSRSLGQHGRSEGPAEGSDRVEYLPVEPNPK